MDILSFNREAWNKQVESGNPWTLPVSPEKIQAARQGDWGILLTPTISVPRAWFPVELRGADVLCLACGGGQQGPILAAAGARVTVLDNSPRQLDQDRMVAAREGLEIVTVEGDMADLHMFADASFDRIVHPVSNVYVEDVLPVWREAWRVLRPEGQIVISGFNPFSLYGVKRYFGREQTPVIVRRHHRAVREVKSVRVWSRNAEKRSKFAGAMNAIAAESAQHAVEGADVVVTATWSKDPVLEASWVRPDAVVCAVGSNDPKRRELPGDLIGGIEHFLGKMREEQAQQIVGKLRRPHLHREGK